jgi:hypothetical protein
MSGPDDWNNFLEEGDSNKENETKVFDFTKNKGTKASNVEIENLLKSYLYSDVTDVLCELLNADFENPDDEVETGEIKNCNQSIQVLENDLMKLQRGVDRLYELLDFDLDLITNDQLIDVDKGFIEKYMYALQLLDSVDDKIREDFISLRQTSVADVRVLHAQWKLPIKEATQFIEKHLDEMEKMINDIARKHIKIGIRIKECILSKSKNRPEYENLVTYLSLDNGTIEKKRETLSTGKVGPVGKRNRTTEQSFILPDEDAKGEELSIAKRKTRRIIQNKKTNLENSLESANSENLFDQNNHTTLKIEQFSLEELIA